MTFKTNVPDRWIENPDQLPSKSFNEQHNNFEKKRGMSLATGADANNDLRQAAIKVNNHFQSASLSQATFQASKARENFRSFGVSKDDMASSEKS